MRKCFLCGKCKREAIMCMKYDAFYCPHCDIWCEPVCGSPNCAFCEDRPAKPSDWLAEEQEN